MSFFGRFLTKVIFFYRSLKSNAVGNWELFDQNCMLKKFSNPQGDRQK